MSERMNFDGVDLNPPATVTVKLRIDTRKFRREVKTAEARMSNLDKPLSIPSAQEIVMRQELGEFDR